MKLRFSGENLAAQLSAAMGALTQSANAAASGAIKDLANQTYYKAREMASVRLNSTKQTYIDSLRLGKRDGFYVISLDAAAAHLEEGYGSFDMKPGLLKGNVVPHGQKGVHMSKEGYRYRVIPFQTNPAAANPGNANHNQPVQIQQFRNGQIGELRTLGDLAKDAKALIKQAGWSGTTTGSNGQPIIGKVGTLAPNNLNRNQLRVTGGPTDGVSVGGDSPVDSRLTNLTKYQYEVQKRDGSTMVKSAYMTFRVVSEKQTNKWIHPGYHGAKIFGDLEYWAGNQLSKIMDEILSGKR